MIWSELIKPKKHSTQNSMIIKPLTKATSAFETIQKSSDIKNKIKLTTATKIPKYLTIFLKLSPGINRLKNQV